MQVFYRSCFGYGVSLILKHIGIKRKFFAVGVIEYTAVNAYITQGVGRMYFCGDFLKVFGQGYFKVDLALIFGYFNLRVKTL